MKKSFSFIITVVLFSLSFNARQGSDPFYYYFDEKVYLQQTSDQVLLKFAPNANKERLLAIVGSDASLQATSRCNFDEGNTLRLAVLKSKDGKRISSSTLESYKAKEDVLSATYLFQVESSVAGFMDEFLLMLKPSTSYAQLLELARRNDCTVCDDNILHKNEFKLFVSKTSKFDAMKMANLFYETGLFEWAAPNFFHFDILHSNDTYFGNQWGLKNTGQYSGSVNTYGIDIQAEPAWLITQGIPNIKVAVLDNGVDLTHPDFMKT